MATCFISAAAGINTLEIKQVLLQKGLDPIQSSEIPSLGQTVFEKISDLIRRADLFIAIFDNKLSNQNTFVELGIAVAHKKRILTISPPGFNLPFNLSGILRISSDPQENEAIRFAIDQLSHAPKPTKPQPKKAGTLGKALGNKSDDFLDRLKSLETKPRGIELARMVYDILEESGISVIAQSTRGQKGTDFAIWSDELGTILGNPILVEVKQSLKNEIAARRTSNQILRYMEKSNSRSALILYLKGLPPDAAQRAASSLQIIFVRIPELVDCLKTESFEHHIRTRRNLIAHGRV